MDEIDAPLTGEHFAVMLSVRSVVVGSVRIADSCAASDYGAREATRHVQHAVEWLLVGASPLLLVFDSSKHCPKPEMIEMGLTLDAQNATKLTKVISDADAPSELTYVGNAFSSALRSRRPVPRSLAAIGCCT